MGGLSIWHILIVALLFIVLFGKGKISDLMGDVAKGLKSFKKGMADDEASVESPKTPESVTEIAKPAAKPKTVRKPAAKTAAKPRLAIEDKTKPAAKPAPRKRKTTNS